MGMNTIIKLGCVSLKVVAMNMGNQASSVCQHISVDKIGKDCLCYICLEGDSRCCGQEANDDNFGNHATTSASSVDTTTSAAANSSVRRKSSIVRLRELALESFRHYAQARSRRVGRMQDNMGLKDDIFPGTSD